MSASITIDTTSFDRAVRSLVAHSSKDAREVMRDEMRLLVQRCVELTAPPHGRGGGMAAKKSGENAVDRDIRRLFISMQMLPEKFTNTKLKERIRDLVDARDHAGIVNLLSKFQGKLRDLEIRNTAEASVHDAARVRGKIPRGVQPIGIIDERSIDRLIKETKKHVGRAKAGWNAAVNKFKVKSIPAWVKRHGTINGEAFESFNERGGELVAINHDKAIGDLNRKASIVQNALFGRARDIQDKIERMIKYSAQKSGFK